MHQAVLLHQLPGSFPVEVSHDADQNELTHLFSFKAGSGNGRFEDYALFMKLPDWLE